MASAQAKLNRLDGLGSQLLAFDRSYQETNGGVDKLCQDKLLEKE